MLGYPHDPTDRSEDVLGPAHVCLAGVVTGGDGGGPRPDEGRGVRHGSHHRGSTAQPVLEPLDGDARDDRDEPLGADLGHLPTRRFGVVGLDGQHRAVRSHRRGIDDDAGVPVDERRANTRELLAHRQLGRLGPLRGEQPTEQGLAHPASADDHQTRPRHRAEATPSVGGPGAKRARGTSRQLPHFPERKSPLRPSGLAHAR